MTFKVFRPNGGLSYKVVGHDGPQPLNPGVVNTFATSIAVQPGDIIGLHHGDNAAETACNFDTTDTYFELAGDLLDGQSGTFHDYGPGNCCFYRLNVTAVFDPSNTITVGKTTLNRKKGTATLNLTVPNPGELVASGKGVKAASAGRAVTSKAVSAGPATLLIRAKGKQRKKLNATGKVKLKVTISYTPTNGNPATRSTKVKLKKKK